MNQEYRWRPVYWEPVADTGERLMVAVIVDCCGQINAHRLIRDDILDSLYGNYAKGAKNLIDTGLDTLAQLANASGGIGNLPAIFGLNPGELRQTQSESIGETLRIAALMYSSLCNPDRLDMPDDSDAPTQDESNRGFSAAVKSMVLEGHPEYADYFGRSAVLVEGGTPTKFGFCSPRAILHFGVLSAVRQPSSVKDARSKLWELHRARELASFATAGLIFATPCHDDPTLSDRQVKAMRQNVAEIEREADSYNMRLFPVMSISEGAEKVVEHA